MGLMDKLKKTAEQASDKANELADEHGEQIEKGLVKAADVADEKTGGKYHDKIETATDKAADAIDKMERDDK